MYSSYSSLEVPTGGKEKDKGVSSEPLRMSRALTPSGGNVAWYTGSPFA